MTILKIEPYDNGAHANQTSDAEIPVPDGWAVLPEHVGTPETLEHYPFGGITVDEVDGVQTVLSWTPLPIPEPEPEPERTYTADEIVKAILGG